MLEDVKRQCIQQIEIDAEIDTALDARMLNAKVAWVDRRD